MMYNFLELIYIFVNNAQFNQIKIPNLTFDSVVSYRLITDIINNCLIINDNFDLKPFERRIRSQLSLFLVSV